MIARSLSSGNGKNGLEQEEFGALNLPGVWPAVAAACSQRGYDHCEWRTVHAKFC
jgi:hypothetical protein